MAADRARLAAGGLILLLAAGCSTPEPAPPAPTVVTLAVAELTEPVGSQMPSSEADLCRAGEHQYLVGQPRSRIPVPVEVVNRRVVCSTCPVTEDFSAYRLNIVYDAETDLIQHVRCG